MSDTAKFSNTGKKRIPRTAGLRIIEDMAAEANTTIKDILGRSNFRDHVAARYRAIRMVANQFPNAGVKSIGLLFCRNHATILYALGRTKRSQVKQKGPDKRKRRSLRLDSSILGHHAHESNACAGGDGDRIIRENNNPHAI